MCDHMEGKFSSVVRPLTQVSQKPLHGSKSNFLWEVTYPQYLQTAIFSVSKMFGNIVVQLALE